MPVFTIAAIVAGAGLLTNIGGTIAANKRNKDLADDLAANLNDQAEAVNAERDETRNSLDSLYAGDIPIPIQKVTPEDVQIPQTAYDALDDAVSDNALANYADKLDRGLSARVAATSGNSRIAAVNAAKAVEDATSNYKTTATELAKEKQKAKLTVAGMETDANKQNVANQLAADRDYADFKNAYVQQKEQDLIDYSRDLFDESRDLAYQAIEIPGMAKVQNAANTANLGSDMATLGIQGMGAAEDGARLRASDSYSDFNQNIAASMQGDKDQTFNSISDFIENGGIDKMKNHANEMSIEREKKRADKAKEQGLTSDNNMVPMESIDPSTGINLEAAASSGSKDLLQNIDPEMLASMAKMVFATGGKMGTDFAKQNGGQVDMTEGEFNHGAMDQPSTGNDQVLIDEEDLMNLVNSGQANDYKKDVEPLAKIKTTGEELVFSNQQSAFMENLAKATDPNESLMGMARDGAKISRKKSEKEVRDAEKKLAAYMRSLLAKPQFQK